MARRLAREAGLSPRALRERARRAGGSRDLYLTAYELAMALALERARRAAEAERHWSAQVRAALQALLSELAARPELARACAAVEACAGQEPVRAGREPVLGALGALLCPGRSAGADDPDRRLLADGVLQTIARTVRESSPEALPGLRVHLHWSAVAARVR
jgi:hypothetical protein